MKYRDLRDFIAQLQTHGRIAPRIDAGVHPAGNDRNLRPRAARGRPALLKSCSPGPQGHSMPVLGNLFGTPRRVALGMGAEEVSALRDVGKLLSYLKDLSRPGAEDVGQMAGVQKVLNMAPKNHPPCALSGRSAGRRAG